MADSSILTVNPRQVNLNECRFELPHLDPQPFSPNLPPTLLNPVWLQESKYNGYCLIDGFRTVRWALNNDIPLLPALIFSSDIKTIDIWNFRIEKRILEHNAPILGIVEKLLESPKFSLSPDNLILFKKLGLKSKSVTIKAFKSLLRQKKDLLAFTDFYRLQSKEIPALLRSLPREITFLAELLDGGSLKGNKLVSLLQIVAELRQGYDISVDVLPRKINLKAIKAIERAEQRYKVFKAELVSLRYPRLTEMKRVWEEERKKSALSQKIEITVDDHFENDYLELQIKADSENSLEQSLAEIRKALNSGTFKPLFELI